jgi:putative molybdopterin biosynthesis protein
LSWRTALGRCRRELEIDFHQPTQSQTRILALGFVEPIRERILRFGQALTSREIGMLAAFGLGEVAVWRQPRVAIFLPAMRSCHRADRSAQVQVYDSYAAVLAAAARPGGEPAHVVGDFHERHSQTA